MPPIPMAASRLMAPVGMASTRTRGESAPMRMMAPLPQVFSICVMARLSALRRSAERVLHVIQLAVDEADAVEPIDVGGPTIAVDPYPGRLHQLAPLGSRHRLERTPEGVPAAGLHLHECHQVSPSHDQVDLDAAGAKPVRHDRPAAGQQIVDRPLLPRQAALVALVGPGAGVTAKAALHAPQTIGAPTDDVTESMQAGP